MIKKESTINDRPRYQPEEIEPKWQEIWDKTKASLVKEDPDKRKYYILDMFPYPSGDGLHVGHPEGYTATDIMARYQTMHGKNVLHPMGFDSFGLPAENAAIKRNIHPQEYMAHNIERFRQQIKRLGFMYDWSREVDTSDPEYYRWTQWMFLKMFERGLAYQAEVPINWCPSCKTGLANEEVVDGKCERCDTPVQKKKLKQWLLKITDYADKLLKGLDDIDWPESIKTLQKNWIGRSEGAEIEFKIYNEELKIKSNEKSQCLIIHGIGGHRRENWFPWLKSVLKKNGYTVNLPTLPITDHPEVDVWNEALKKESKSSSVLIGHSIGATAALNLVQTTDRPVDQIILVAPVNPEQDWKHSQEEFPEADWNAIKQFADIKFDWKKINKLVKHIVIYYSDNDPFISVKSIGFYKRHLPNATFKLLPGKGHFNERDGITEFPEILDVLTPKIKVFTTRPDTLFGATYLVLAPEHSIINNLKFKINKYREVEEYIRKAAHKSDLERTDLAKEKTGIELKGIKAINPVNNEKVPVWVADYVLASYGSGAIMAVPAHDQRDFEFAETHRIEKKVVIQPITAVECWMYDIEPIYGLSEYEKGQYKELKSGKKRPINYSKGSIPTTKAFVGKGIMIRSKQFDGTGSDQGSKEIIEWLDKNKTGHASVNYRLRDWIFSRQRYWGEPIPIIHCEKCGAVPVPEKDLPVKLPTLKDFKPTGTGESPLAKVDNWVNVKCPECNGPAKRETNTMPNWAGDSWYYLRYCDPKNNKAFADKEILKYWLPVDLYVGGAEHAVLHLLYARFWHKVLYDAKLVPTSEPFQKLRNQGLILGEDNQKMSKSRGNVVNPDDVVNKHGADAFRIYEMFMGPFEDVKPWSTHGIVGVKRFLDKTWLAQEKLGSKTDPETMRLLHQTIKKVSSDIETFSFNTAVSSLMIFANRLMNVTTINNKDYKAFIQLLSPFAPHLAEELWERLGNKESIFKSSWPKYNPKLVKEETFDLVVQINGKVRARVGSPVGLTEETARHVAESDENVKKYLENIDLKKIKVIFIKNKLINYVV